MTKIANPPSISKRDVLELVSESGVGIFGCILYVLVFTFFTYLTYVFHWWGFMIFQFVVFGVPFVLLVLGWTGTISFVGLVGAMEWVTAKVPYRPASEQVVISLYGILLIIFIFNYLSSA